MRGRWVTDFEVIPRDGHGLAALFVKEGEDGEVSPEPNAVVDGNGNRVATIGYDPYSRCVLFVLTDGEILAVPIEHVRKVGP